MLKVEVFLSQEVADFLAYPFSSFSLFSLIQHNSLTFISVSRFCDDVFGSTACGHHLRSATNNLPPILFHSIHGENVRISSNGTTATRVNSYCKAIVFSNRAIKEKERVYIKFSEISSSWSGALRFGFTSVNPSSYRSCSNLPKYVCPDMTDKEGSWAKALSERFATPDSILCFYFTSDGNIHYAINGEDKGYFSLGLQGNSLWALIDIYGNTTGIQIIDPRLQSNNFNNDKSQTLVRRSQSMGVIRAGSSEDEEDCLYESMAGLSVVDHDLKREPLPRVYSKVHMSPLAFHRTRGCNIRLSNDRWDITTKLLVLIIWQQN